MHEESKYLKCEHMHRDPKLATNKTDGHQLFLNEIENFPEADIYVQYLCTSPFLKEETIDKAIRLLKEHPEHDSVILMKKDKVYGWSDGQPTYDINHIPNSKDLPFTITESMALYVIRKETALKLRRRFGDNPLFVYATPLEYLDVNLPEDFEAAEIIAEGFRAQEVRHLNLLKHFISSPILSDIIDDFEAEKGITVGHVLPGFQCNIGNSVIFGRAKTLALRPLEPGENFEGIYDALHSYESITNGDIIVVANKLPQYAYFGDLNTRLAIRSGASGVIVNSVTRDLDRVKLFNLPVFSRGRNAADVRRRATVESINQEIFIAEASIRPGDFIFADADAVVVLKEEFFEDITKIAMEKINQEHRVSLGIMKQQHSDQLLQENGGF